jgi:hypothetical protein
MPRPKKQKLEILEGETPEQLVDSSLDTNKVTMEPVKLIEPKVDVVIEQEVTAIKKPRRVAKKIVEEITPEAVVAVDNSKELQKKLKEYEELIKQMNKPKPDNKKPLDERKQSLAEKKLLIQEKTALLKERELQKKEREIEIKLQKLQAGSMTTPVAMKMKRIVESESEEDSDDVKISNIKKKMEKPKVATSKISEPVVTTNNIRSAMTPNQLLALAGF